MMGALKFISETEQNKFRLLVGLGNPGNKYKNTRHNIGFMALEKLAKNQCVDFKQNKKFFGYIAEVEIENQPIKLLMPSTYMNSSGRSIRATLDWFGIDIKQILVLVDDMDLPLGKIRIRSKGGSGGHNGLKNIICHLGSQDFHRIRIGIGSPTDIQAERKEKTNSHVLGTFSETETDIVDKVLDEVIKGLELIQSDGFTKAGNRLNAINLI